ncbi:hypothetical protein JYU34_004967, partial [Plutella xylostella]
VPNSSPYIAVSCPIFMTDLPSSSEWPVFKCSVRVPPSHLGIEPATLCFDPLANYHYACEPK